MSQAATPPPSAGLDGWTDLCAAADVAPGSGHYVEVGTRAIAVLRLASGSEASSASFRVMDDHCPHAGGSLSAGAGDTICFIYLMNCRPTN